MKLLMLLLAVVAHAAKDKDGDGIDDKTDLCKEAPEDMDGFEDEDGCPELDNDRDGKLDEIDQCPLVPEDKDQFQDKDGCPDLDNDEDGVPDVNDECMMEPGTAMGCPDPALVVLASFDNLVKADDIATAEGIFAGDWDENPIGDSGQSGHEMYNEARAEGWFLRPEVMAVETIGTARLVRCDVVQRADEKVLDSVHAVLAVQESKWFIVGAGEDEAAARALAEAQPEKD